MADETKNVESVPTHSNDLLLSGEDRLKLNELMEHCTNLSQRVLDLGNTKTSQAAEIAKLKERVKKLERRNKSRTPGLKRLKKVGRTARIESSEYEGLGDQEDASKQGKKITDIDADEEVTLIDETQGRNDDNLMFDTGVLDDQEVEVEKVVSTAEVTTASATPTTVDELTLAQTLIEIKAAKPKAVTTAATTTTTVVTRPKARGVVVQEPSEFTTITSQPSQLPQAKDKGKAKMEEDANIAEWDNVQAIIDANYELAARLQAQEQEELTIEERLNMFMELMDKRKKHFARLRAEEQRRKPPTKAQKKSQMSTYLKDMAGYKQNQLKSKNYDEIQKLFDKAMIRVNMFVDMDTKLVKKSSKKAEMLDENVEAEVDDEAEMKKHMEIVPDDEERWDTFKSSELMEVQGAKHGNTRPEEAYERVLWGDLKVMFEPDIESENLHIIMLVDKMYYQIIRANGSAKFYKIFSAMLDDFDKQDVLDLYRLVKERFETTSPEGYDRLLWGDLITLFEPIHLLLMDTGITIHMMVEKKYPLTQEMLSRMLSGKLEVDHECEMAYELLRFTKSQYKKIVGIKRHLSAVEVTAAGYISTAGEVQRKYSKSLLLLVVKLLLLVLVTTARRVSAVRV
ncbi:hypothetical protein Tco_0227947 [Tanacetum coccineum]